MTSYLLIESRDPFESHGLAQRCELASALVAEGAQVTLFLVENGVLAAREAAQVREIEELGRLGVTVLADDFALRERGITPAQLAREVKPSLIDALVEELGRGAKAIWN
ncbi:MAG TPA: DsrE family protein [Steroidobacteraceae bacterium]|nr:DsrE family protein [Steroidobacteraceae bacterium]